MFLVELNAPERKTFLELANHAMSASGEIKPEEKEIFRSYAYECEMPDYQVQGTSLATLVSSAKSYSQRKRRLILIELWGIILADESVNTQEATWMEKLAQDMELSPAQARRIKRWSKDFVEIIEDGYRLIAGE